jgi:hypothetical protein
MGGFQARPFRSLTRVNVKGAEDYGQPTEHADCRREDIQERLGHSSIAVTIDLCGYLAEMAQATAAARLDKALGGAITPK